MNVTLAITSVFFCLLFAFRKRIIEEYRLLSGKEAGATLDEGIYSMYIPYTGRERTAILEKHVQNLKGIQERLSKSVIAKYFIDYSESIEGKETLIREELDWLDSTNSECISFSTPDLNQIVGDPSFDPDRLLILGDLIDEVSSELEVEFQLTDVVTENGIPVVSININLNELDKLQEECFQTFANETAQNVFECAKVNLEVICYDSSENSNPEDDSKTYRFTAMKI